MIKPYLTTVVLTLIFCAWGQQDRELTKEITQLKKKIAETKKQREDQVEQHRRQSNEFSRYKKEQKKIEAELVQKKKPCANIHNFICVIQSKFIFFISIFKFKILLLHIL